MPTPEEIREYRQWRGRFISALWDAEAASSAPAAEVPALFEQIGADVLADNTKARLVNDLEGDGLIEAFAATGGFSYPQDVRLTSYGRLEVERWIADGEPTEHLALPPSQVFNTHIHGDVTGSPIVIGSTGTTVNVQVAVGEHLSELIVKSRELLAQWDGAVEDREEIESDIATLRDLNVDPQVPASRVKIAARRIARWAAAASAAGMSAELAGEVHELASQVIQAL